MKIKKALKYTLAVALVFGTATTLTGCGKDDDTTQELTQQEKIYNLAVSAGYEGTYEQWIASIRGADGEDGKDGKDGKDGATWYTGTDAPIVEQGVSGDFYFDSDSKTIYNKVNGVWTEVASVKGEKGDEGDPGTDGATWLSGTNEPANSLGAVGDFYFETDAQKIYKKTGTTTWTEVAEIKDGIDGVNGAAWHVGTSYPSSETGVDGDFYFDAVSQKIYQKVSGSWGSAIATIEDGVDGKDGSTWLSGEVVPGEETGKEGDFYFDTLGKDIYKKISETEWEKIASLDEDKEVIKVNQGLYLYSEIGNYDGVGYSHYLTIQVDDNETVTSAVDSEVITLPEGFNLEFMNYIPVAVNNDTNVVTLAVYDESNPQTPIQLDTDKQYTVEQEINDVSFDGIYQISGKIMGDLSVIELEYQASISALDEYDFEIVDGYIKLSSNGYSAYFIPNEEIDYNGEKITTLKQTVKIDEEFESLVYGTYKGVSEDNVLTMNDKYALLFYRGNRLQGTIEYLYGSIEEGGIVVNITTDFGVFEISLDLYCKSLQINNIKYNYAKTYENKHSKLLISETDGVYSAKINDEDVLITVESINEDDGHMYATIVDANDTYSVEINPDDCTYKKVLLAEDVFEGIDASVEYIETEVYNMANPNVDGSENYINDTNDDYKEIVDHYYVSVAYVDTDALPPINEITINDVLYSKDDYLISVGNNNFIKLPVWKVENDKLYVSGLALKSAVLKSSNGITIQIDNYETIYLTNQSVNSELLDQINSDEVYVGKYVTTTQTKLNTIETVKGVAMDYVSTNGTNTIRFFIANEDKEGISTAFAYTQKIFYDVDTGEQIGSTSGYTALDKIGSSYYVAFYPSYFAGDYTYEEPKEYLMEYSIITDNGITASYLVKITLSAPAQE